MTEKRFTLLEKKGYDYCIGFVDNLTGNHLSNWDMMKLANDLNNENEQLKKRIKELMKEVDALSDGEADWLIDEML